LLEAIYWTGLCIPLLLLGNGSVNTFPPLRRIVGDVVFYAVSVFQRNVDDWFLPGLIDILPFLPAWTGREFSDCWLKVIQLWVWVGGNGEVSLCSDLVGL
jgi:hypothetical protein